MKKVKYCVNNPESGVLYLHFNEEELGKEAVVFLEKEDQCSLVAGLPKGTVVLVELNQELQVLSVEVD